MEGYGLTEGTTASSINPPDGEQRIGSIGVRFPYQPMKTVKVDADGKHAGDCAVDEQGVIAIKGPNVFPGYKQDQFNDGIWVEEGWFNTGDLGRQDADGYFWLTGRAKDLIIRGGHNIDPAMIEETLHQHPDVALAAAVGKPDSYAGEIPIAYVALKPGATADADALCQYAREKVAERPAAPAEVVIIDAMPVTAVGKIFKPNLRYDATRRVYDAALESVRREGIEISVSVAADETLGTLATITVTASDADQPALEQEISRILGAFAIPHRVVWQ
jgi:fatty-acyl-CoA synthase